MQDAGLERVGQRHSVAGAGHVGALVVLVRGRHVVDGGEMEEVLDVAAVLVDPALLDTEALPREVADDGRDALAALPVLGQLRQALL